MKTPHVAFGIVACLLAACTDNPIGREVVARLASPAWMVERPIKANDLVLTAYERVHERGLPATVYIEGEGMTVNDLRTLAIGSGMRLGSAAPINPVALHLATRDKARNVVYLALPCQFTGLAEKEDVPNVPESTQTCDDLYTGKAAYAEGVIAAMDSALSNIARRYDIKGFNLVGYQGGGAVAALLAARRSDVLSLRTVDGILDTQAFTDHHHMAAMDASLNPIDIAPQLTNLPQVHFIGGQDDVVPPMLAARFIQAESPTVCARTVMIQEAGTNDGWVDKWPDLLADLPVCHGALAAPAASWMDAPPEHPHSVREHPEKP